MRLSAGLVVISPWVDCVLSKNGFGFTVLGIFRRLIGKLRFQHTFRSDRQRFSQRDVLFR